jgi:hypothetical protein
MLQPEALPRKIESMAKKQKKIEDSFVFFDVIYDDGTKSSRRKINAAGVAPEDVEAFVLTEVMNQDRRIAEMSGKTRGNVKSLVKSS